MPRHRAPKLWLASEDRGLPTWGPPPEIFVEENFCGAPPKRPRLSHPFFTGGAPFRCQKPFPRSPFFGPMAPCGEVGALSGKKTPPRVLNGPTPLKSFLGDGPPPFPKFFGLWVLIPRRPLGGGLLFSPPPIIGCSRRGLPPKSPPNRILCPNGQPILPFPSSPHCNPTTKFTLFIFNLSIFWLIQLST